MSNSQVVTRPAEPAAIAYCAEVTSTTVVHKAFVSVDEEGTEAAAAAGVVMAESGPGKEPIAVTVDRPFIFIIRDHGTGTVLFVGRVSKPDSSRTAGKLDG